MLAQGEHTLTVQNPAGFTIPAAQETLNAALLAVKRYCEQGYNNAACTYSPAGTMIGLGWLAENGNAGSGHGGSSYQSVFGDLLYRHPGLTVKLFPPGFSRIYWLGGRQLRGASGREHS